MRWRGLGGAKFCRHFDLGGDGLRQHPGGMQRDRGAGQREIAELLVLERKLDFLDLFVGARARQPLREMTPVGGVERTFAVVRAGRCDMRARSRSHRHAVFDLDQCGFGQLG